MTINERAKFIKFLLIEYIAYKEYKEIENTLDDNGRYFLEEHYNKYIAYSDLFFVCFYHNPYLMLVDCYNEYRAFPQDYNSFIERTSIREAKKLGRK